MQISQNCSNFAENTKTGNVNTKRSQIKRFISKYKWWGIAVIVLLLPVVLVQIPSVQQLALRATTNYIEEKTNTKIDIQSVDFHLFNKLTLKEVVWKDSAGDTLLSAKRFSVGFEFWPLFKKQYCIRSMQFNTFTVYLNRENENAPLNIQSILQAFQKNDTSEKSIDLRIRNISLYKGNVIYQIKNQIYTDEIFHFGDLHFSDINSKINIQKLTNEGLNIFVKHFNFKEKSGFQVKDLSFDLSANKDSANIQKLKLQLPESQLNIVNVSSDYSVLQSDKNDWKNVLFDMQIQDSYFSLNDLKAFIPTLNNCSETIQLEGFVSGKIDELFFQQIHLVSGKELDLAADVSLQNITSKNPAKIYLQACLNDSHISEKLIRNLIDGFTVRPIQWPPMIQEIGSVNLKGEVSGFLNHFNTDIKALTDIGDLQIQLDFRRAKLVELAGVVSSNKLNINQLFQNNDFGNARFQLHFNSRFRTLADWQGDVDATIDEFVYKSYPYSNIRLTGNYAQKQLQCHLENRTPHGNMAADASIHFQGHESEYALSADVSKLLLKHFNLTQKQDNPQLSFRLQSHLKGNTIDNLTGHLQINKFQYTTDDKKLNINELAINISQTDSIKKLHIESDLLSGDINGVFDLSTLPMALKQSVAEYLPSFISDTPSVWAESNQDFTWNFILNNTEILSSILNLPATIYEKSKIEGKFDNHNREILLKASIPQFYAGGMLFENGTLDLNNGNGYLELQLNATNLPQKRNEKMAMGAIIKASSDSIFTDLYWNDKSKYNGHLFFTSQITMPANHKPLEALLRFNASEMMFNDSIWKIEPTLIHYQDKIINIRQFEANHNRQNIKIDGNISHNENDEIFISLTQVDLDYIFKSLSIRMGADYLIFGGIATGNVRAQDLYHTRQLSTRLDVRDFSFNNQIFGDLDLLGLWNDEKRHVEMIGKAVRNDSSFVNINGYIDPMNKAMSILFNAHKTEVRFLHPFLDNIVKNLSGEATGPIRLFGALRDPTVEGEVWLQNGSFGIEFLNTRYSFSDWIRFKPDEIYMQNVKVFDKDGHSASFSGSVKHDLLSNFRFTAHIVFDNFLVFNATQYGSPNFYGTVYGTGNVDIAGNEKLVNIDMKVHNENTELVFDFMKQANIADFNFIRFTPKEKEVKNTITQENINRERKGKKKNADTKTEIHLNLMVNANNKAMVDFIMDPVSGDKISATGTGSMQVQYGTDIPAKVFGNYRIEQGKYNFSFQQAIYRKFDIENGSSIAFKGDPLTAEMDIKAACEVSANLGDLNQQLISSSDRRSARTSVPVNCVLLLSGPLQHPAIKFDLEMPGSTAELERQVKSYIRTEDMMNRQIIYLLLMNRFYTPPEYATANTGFNNDFSLLSSTLSSSISSLLGSLSDKIQVGTNFHQFYENAVSKTEVELLLSSTLLNNRLIINGNIGYVDNPHLKTLTNDIPLIGDFDFEYKLTPSGNTRLKGFNHYNYRNYYSLTPEMTQGFGILFRKDFNNIREFLLRKKTPTEVETNNTSEE